MSLQSNIILKSYQTMSLIINFFVNVKKGLIHCLSNLLTAMINVMNIQGRLYITLFTLITKITWGCHFYGAEFIYRQKKIFINYQNMTLMKLALNIYGVYGRVKIQLNFFFWLDHQDRIKKSRRKQIYTLKKARKLVYSHQNKIKY